MSVTLSPPVRVFALLGALVVTGLAAFLLLLGRGSEGATPAPPVHVTRPATRPTSSQPAAKPVARHRPVQLVAGLPGPVAHALRYSRVVVVAVYVPGASVDALVRTEARAAARTSRAGYVGIGATSEIALQRLVAKTGVLPDPAVVVLRRPGVVAAKLGVADRETIAQAIVQARHAR